MQRTVADEVFAGSFPVSYIFDVEPGGVAQIHASVDITHDFSYIGYEVVVFVGVDHAYGNSVIGFVPAENSQFVGRVECPDKRSRHGSPIHPLYHVFVGACPLIRCSL